jgi:hypothetical protein
VTYVEYEGPHAYHRRSWSKPSTFSCPSNEKAAGSEMRSAETA